MLQYLVTGDSHVIWEFRESLAVYTQAQAKYSVRYSKQYLGTGLPLFPVMSCPMPGMSLLSTRELVLALPHFLLGSCSARVVLNRMLHLQLQSYFLTMKQNPIPFSCHIGKVSTTRASPCSIIVLHLPLVHAPALEPMRPHTRVHVANYTASPGRSTVKGQMLGVFSARPSREGVELFKQGYFGTWNFLGSTKELPRNTGCLLSTAKMQLLALMP